MPVMIKKFPDYTRIFDSLGRTPGEQVTVAEDMRNRYRLEVSHNPRAQEHNNFPLTNDKAGRPWP